jgi:hypothetical protein
MPARSGSLGQVRCGSARPTDCPFDIKIKPSVHDTFDIYLEKDYSFTEPDFKNSLMKLFLFLISDPDLGLDELYQEIISNIKANKLL